MALRYRAPAFFHARPVARSRPIVTSRPEAGPLAPVTLGATTIAEYFYDGDGNRVKGVVNGETTYYPGRHYETTAGSGSTKYYFANDGLVAFRRSGYPRNNGLRYVFRDHLGSTSVIANGGGTKLWEDRYKAFGDFRYTWIGGDGHIPVQTDYRYTGQRYDAAVGLYDYRARWYDPALGRFILPDTIVPQPGDPQSLNRYSYASNSPIVYTDPTGMFTETEIQNYLRDTYGDDWEAYWNAWQADPYWMAVLYDAQDGYVLDVPSLGSSGSVIFTQQEGSSSFTITATEKLHHYQGRPGYVLYDKQRQQVHNSFLTYLEEHGHLSHREAVIYQPLYDYSSGVPVFTYQWSRATFQSQHQRWVWDVDDSTPFVVTFAGWLLKKFHHRSYKKSGAVYQVLVLCIVSTA